MKSSLGAWILVNTHLTKDFDSLSLSKNICIPIPVDVLYAFTIGKSLTVIA